MGSRQLTLWLLKESIGEPADALRDRSDLRHVELSAGVPYEGEFWWISRTSRSPVWEAFVEPVLARPLSGLMAASASAVLFVRAGGRLFAFTFGHGRALLRSDSYEPRFGLRVALNRVSPEHLRSVDTLTYEDIMVTTRKHASRSAGLDAFGLNVSQDLLRAVTGEPEDRTLARRITGSDALVLTTDITADALGAKCLDILAAYEDDRYKERFPWVDNLAEVRDTGLVSVLGDKLVAALQSGDTGKLHLAPPEAIDWQKVEAFRIEGTRKVEYEDLDIDRYLSERGTAPLTLSRLKSAHVQVRWSGTEEFRNEWSLFDCIVWEVEHNGRLFALVGGRWFEIESGFAQQVLEAVRMIPPPTWSLPSARPTEDEREYNKRVAEQNPQVVCLDTVLARPRGASTPIELCDLLSHDGELVFVKRKTRSATLSHLFAQGTVSARTFLQDGTFRDQIRSSLQHMSVAREFIELIPTSAERPSADRYSVRYTILARPAASWPDSLPFFSQLNLLQNARILHGLGFSVALEHVEQPAA